MTYDSFISGLKNLEGDQKELKRLKEKKEDMEYLESGTKGLDPSKIHVSGNPSVVAEIRLTKIDELCELEEEIKLLQANIQHVMKVFDLQDEVIKVLLTEIYFKGNKKTDVARRFGFASDVNMERHIKRYFVAN